MKKKKAKSWNLFTGWADLLKYDTPPSWGSTPPHNSKEIAMSLCVKCKKYVYDKHICK